MQTQVDLSGGPSAAHAARSAVVSFAAALSDALPEATVDDLKLLVSELVTNSIRHGGITERGLVSLRIRSLSGVVRVEVENAGLGFEPHAPEAALDRTSGYGLVLVERLSRRWGVEGSDSVRVWFELAVPSADQPISAGPVEEGLILEPA